MEALGIKLLQRLSSSLMSVEEHRHELRDFQKKVTSSLGVLEELARCAGRVSVGENVSQISRKRPKAPARHMQLDPHPFDCMGIAVPVTEVEVRALCGNVLPQLQSVLGVRVFLSLWLVLNHNLASALPARPEAT